MASFVEELEKLIEKWEGEPYTRDSVGAALSRCASDLRQVLSAQQSVHADAEIEKQAEVLFQEIANAKAGNIPDEVISEWKKLGKLLYNVPHTQHDA